MGTYYINALGTDGTYNAHISADLATPAKHANSPDLTDWNKSDYVWVGIKLSCNNCTKNPISETFYICVRKDGGSWTSLAASDLAAPGTGAMNYTDLTPPNSAWWTVNNTGLCSTDDADGVAQDNGDSVVAPALVADERIEIWWAISLSGGADSSLYEFGFYDASGNFGTLSSPTVLDVSVTLAAAVEDRNINITTEPLITVTDVPTVLLPDALKINVFEAAITVTDVITDIEIISPPIEVSEYEEVTVTDVPTVTLPDDLTVSVFDTTTVTEGITVRMHLEINVYDEVEVSAGGVWMDFHLFGAGTFPSAEFSGEWGTILETTSYFEVVVDASGYGYKVIRGYDTGPSTNINGLSLDDATPVSVDGEILARVAPGDTTGMRCMLVHRGAGDNLTEYAYFACLRNGELQIGKVVNGSWSHAQDTYTFAFSADTWYWMRFKIKRYKLEAKVWAGDFDSEPSTYQVSWTDGAKSIASGWVGLAMVSDITASDYDAYDWFAFSPKTGKAEGPGDTDIIMDLPIPPILKFDEVTVTDIAFEEMDLNIDVFEAAITVADVPVIQMDRGISVFDSAGVTDVPTVYVEPVSLYISVSDTVKVNSQSFYVTDWSEYTVNDWPSDFTNRFHAGSKSTIYFQVQSNGQYGNPYQVVRSKDPGVANRYAASWDDVGTVTDVEVLVRARAVSAEDGHRCVVPLRGSGTDTTETAYIISVNLDLLKIGKLVAGAWTGNLDTYSFSFSADTWYWIRARVIGDIIQAKIWSGSFDSEPVDWQVEAVDTDIPGPGWVGIYNDGGGTDDYDWFSVATDGAHAEGPGERGFAVLDIPIDISEFEETTVTDVPTVLLPGAPSNIFEFETVTVADVPTVELPDALVISVFDSTTVTEDITTRVDLHISEFESVTVEESVEAELPDDLVVSEFETVTVTDYLSNIKVVDPGLEMNKFETVTVTDDVTVELPDPLVLSVFDSTGVTDVPTVQVEAKADVEPSVFDSTTVQEDVTVRVDLNPSVFSSTTVEEWVSVRIDLNLSVFDTATVQEQVTAALPDALAIIVYEETGVTEYVELYRQLPGEILVNVYDTVNTLDIAFSSPVEPTNISVFDSTTVTELAVSLLSDAEISVFDAVTVQEDVTVRIDINISVFESIPVTEYVIGSLPDSLVISEFEVVTVNDWAKVEADLGIFEFDTVTVTEHAELFPLDKQVSVFDTVTISESVSAQMPDPLEITVHDTIAVTEGIELYWIVARGLTTVTITERAPLMEFSAKTPKIDISVRS